MERANHIQSTARTHHRKQKHTHVFTHTNLCTQMFTAPPYLKTLSWKKSKEPLADAHLSKLSNIYTMK